MRCLKWGEQSALVGGVRRHSRWDQRMGANLPVTTLRIIIGELATCRVYDPESESQMSAPDTCDRLRKACRREATNNCFAVESRYIFRTRIPNVGGRISEKGWEPVS